MPTPPALTDSALDRAQREADPLADQTVADILGPWADVPTTASAADLQLAHAGHFERIALLNRLISRWSDNASLAGASMADAPAPMAAAVQAYLDAARPLPDWADRARIARAEQIFFDDGVLSCTLLFCASLPECYVVPDLAQVLHVTGQLDQRTDYRIRSTAAMIFPVMMRGGLTDPAGGGVAQVLKVRLIHATVRNLILHGSPEQALAASAGVAPQAALHGAQNMHQALFAQGWDTPAHGLPCNQEEQAYTLLTFGYVYLRGLRTLGVGLAPADEEAVLHAWNVVGHLVGIRRELMADSMAQAKALFERMQARGRAEPVQPDPRPALAEALIGAMQAVIPWRVARPFPVLLMRHLCGRAASADLAIDRHVSIFARALFALAMGIVRGIDTIGRWVSPGFSIARLVTRVLGYHLLTRLLMDQTRPLKLPQRLLDQAGTVMRGWGEDRRAPAWMNTLEDRLTVAGPWQGMARS